MIDRSPPASPAPSAHQDETRRLVGAMMKLTGHSATGLARAAGLTPSTVNRFMHRRVSHTLSQRTMLALMTETLIAIKDKPRQTLDAQALAELAPAVAVYERGILQRAPDVQTTLTAAKSLHTDPAPHASADLPVLTAAGNAANASAGDFRQAPFTTQRPAFLEADPRAFALLMPDGAMSPRFDAGDMLYVSPARGLEGKWVDVVFEHASGGFTVGVLGAVNARTAHLSTLAPRTRQAHDRAKLRGIYRIVGVQRLGG